MLPLFCNNCRQGKTGYRSRGREIPQEHLKGAHMGAKEAALTGCSIPKHCPNDGQPGEGESLTPDAPHNGLRQSTGDVLLPPPQRATLARKSARCRGAGAEAGSSRPQRPAARPEGGQPGEGGHGPGASHPAPGAHNAERSTRPPRPQWARGGPRPPAIRTGSRERVYASPRTSHSEASGA